MEIGMCTQCIISIFRPMKLKTNANPYFRNTKRSATFARRKYIALKPKTAKILDVNTMNGSVVTAKTAGMLSTANITSLNSIMIKTKNSGVAIFLPFSMVKNLSP